MIEKLTLQSPIITTNAGAAPAGSAAAVTRQFGEYLQDALEQVNQTEETVHQMNTQFVKGEVDVADLMIAAEKSMITLQLTGNIRNKVIEAYQEIMRTQI